MELEKVVIFSGPSVHMSCMTIVLECSIAMKMRGRASKHQNVGLFMKGECMFWGT